MGSADPAAQPQRPSPLPPSSHPAFSSLAPPCLLLFSRPTPARCWGKKKAMATAAPHEQERHDHRGAPNATAGTASTIATNRWGPYSGAGDFASNMAVILAALLAALALTLALNAAARYLLRRHRRRGLGRGGAADQEKPPVAGVEAPPPPPPALVYSAAGTKLAGAAECAICLVEFVDGDAVRVMPACGHGFHARCIEAVTLQAAVTQIKGSGAAGGGIVADALPAAAVRASPPRPEGDAGLVGGGEGLFQPEQRRRLGNHMYAEIGSNLAEHKKALLEEGKVYIITKFSVERAKTEYKAVEAPFMIIFAPKTIIEEKTNVPTGFPMYTYNLIPFEELPSYVGKTARFIDVIGTITGESEAKLVQAPGKSTPTLKRIIMLKDLRGQNLKVTLWGQRANEFNGDAVIDIGQKQHVIVIFVGALMKKYTGGETLSGNTACHWYINEDITDIHKFYESLDGDSEKIKKIPIDSREYPASIPIDQLQAKELKELKGMDAFVHSNERFLCTVTITRLSPNQRWWFAQCKDWERSDSARFWVQMRNTRLQNL